MSCEALILQYAAWCVLFIFPFRSIPKLFSYRKSLDPEPDMALLEQIKEAIRYSDRLSIWKNRCLVQSLAARWMLKRRRIASTLCLGVDMDSGSKISSHAWLISHGIEVVPRNGDWQEMWSF